jgi:hypothetical protein
MNRIEGRKGITTSFRGRCAGGGVVGVGSGPESVFPRPGIRTTSRTGASETKMEDSITLAALGIIVLPKKSRRNCSSPLPSAVVVQMVFHVVEIAKNSAAGCQGVRATSNRAQEATRLRGARRDRRLPSVSDGSSGGRGRRGAYG